MHNPPPQLQKFVNKAAHQFYTANNSYPPFPAVVNVGNEDADASPGTSPRRRVPSLTPSERKELEGGFIDWQAVKDWRSWYRRAWLWCYLAVLIVTSVSVLLIAYHKQILDGLKPVTQWLQDQTVGWPVPIVVIFVMSFPPLFGQEIIAILCGLVWGPAIGFGIVAAGILLGEMGSFCAYRFCCHVRGEKTEKTHVRYACLARVVRQGGLKFAVIIRLSVIPGHYTTAVFATCGMDFLIFTVAAIITLPKQFYMVYMGFVLQGAPKGDQSPLSSVMTRAFLGVTLVFAIGALWYIGRTMNRAKPDVIYARRLTRMSKLPGTNYAFTQWQTDSSENLLSQAWRENNANHHSKDNSANSPDTVLSFETESSTTLIHTPASKHASKGSFGSSRTSIERVPLKAADPLNVDRRNDTSPNRKSHAYTPSSVPSANGKDAVSSQATEAVRTFPPPKSAINGNRLTRSEQHSHLWPSYCMSSS